MKLQNSFRDYTAESALFVRRALVAFLGILLLTGVLIANLYNLQIVRFTDYQTRSNENRIKLVPIAPSRGIIYDRNGIPLALNRTIYQIEMMPEKVDNVQQTLDALRSVVDLTDDDIAAFRKERARSHRFTSIPVKTNLTEVQVARFAVNQYRFPGVEVKGYKRRYYPYGSALTHVIGYVSKINDKDVERLNNDGKLANYAATHDIGKLGIERYYEDVLHGQTGYEEVEVNNRGRVIRQLKEVPPHAGTFFRQVDTGVMTITEFTHPFGEAIDSHIVGHLIEEGIRRFFQRSCDIQTPVAPFFPVTITFF
jgi:penicillin-binding protein 2